MEPSAKRLRGWQLEEARVDAEFVGVQPVIAPGNAHSVLASKLLNLWAMGSMSAVTAQSIAHCAMLDGATHIEIATIASAGSFGEHPGNIARDLAAAFLKDIKLPASMNIPVKVLDPKSSKMTEEDASFFCLICRSQLFWSFTRTLRHQQCFQHRSWKHFGMASRPAETRG